MEGEWIGVDLDGTLATYSGWQGSDHIGEPVPEMVRRVREMLHHGFTVKILTARVCKASCPDAASFERICTLIQDWLEREAKLPRLVVTAEKDYAMIELWDDRCFRVETNTGRLLTA